MLSFVWVGPSVGPENQAAEEIPDGLLVFAESATRSAPSAPANLIEAALVMYLRKGGYLKKAER